MWLQENMWENVSNLKGKCNQFVFNLGEYQDLYVQSDTLLLAGLACLATLRKTKLKLNILTDIDMLLVVEKGKGGGKYHSIYWYEKANNKYMKDYDKNKESSYIQY